MAPEDVNNLLVESDFRAWLEEREPGECAGFAGQPHYCPIARYLGEAGVSNPSVNDSEITWQSGETVTPPWAGAFIYRIDGGENLLPVGEARSAKDCLAALDRIHADDA